MHTKITWMISKNITQLLKKNQDNNFLKKYRDNDRLNQHQSSRETGYKLHWNYNLFFKNYIITKINDHKIKY